MNYFRNSVFPLGAAASVFLFLPFVVYALNLNDVEISKHVLLLYGSISTLLAAAFLFLLEAIIRQRFSRGIISPILVTLFLLLIAFPNSAGDITGFSEGSNTAPLLMPALKLFLGALLVVILFLKRPELADSAALMASIVSIVGPLVIFFTMSSSSDQRQYDRAHTIQKVSALGSELNVFVLLLDTFTGHRAADILSKDEALSEQFNGFVIYPNAIAPALNTNAGSSIVLTGDLSIASSSMSWLERNNMSVKESFLVDAQSHGFVPSYISNLGVKLDDEVGVVNLKELDLVPHEPAMNNYVEHLADSVPRVLPSPWIQFLSQRLLREELVLPSVETLPAQSAEALEHYLEKLHIGEHKKRISYYLSKISHPRWNLTEDGAFELGAGWQGHSLYSMKMAAKFLAKLKQLKLYKNSMIVIASDHGGIPYGLNKQRLSEIFGVAALPPRFNPLVMVKAFGQQSPLQVSPSTVWIGDVAETVRDSIGMPSKLEDSPSVSLLAETAMVERQLRVPLFVAPEGVGSHSSLRLWEKIPAEGRISDYARVYSDWKSSR